MRHTSAFSRSRLCFSFACIISAENSKRAWHFLYNFPTNQTTYGLVVNRPNLVLWPANRTSPTTYFSLLAEPTAKAPTSSSPLQVGTTFVTSTSSLQLKPNVVAEGRSTFALPPLSKEIYSDEKYCSGGGQRISRAMALALLLFWSSLLFFCLFVVFLFLQVFHYVVFPVLTQEKWKFSSRQKQKVSLGH
jgi:hypothetical protein